MHVGHPRSIFNRPPLQPRPRDQPQSTPHHHCCLLLKEPQLLPFLLSVSHRKSLRFAARKGYVFTVMRSFLEVTSVHPCYFFW